MYGSNGKYTVTDVKCSRCGRVESYDNYLQSPTRCSRMVMEGNKQVECDGSIVPIQTRQVDHQGRA